MKYSDDEIFGTFIRRYKTHHEVLPTISIIFSKNSDIIPITMKYLDKELSERSQVIIQWSPEYLME